MVHSLLFYSTFARGVDLDRPRRSLFLRLSSLASFCYISASVVASLPNLVYLAFFVRLLVLVADRCMTVIILDQAE